MKKLSKKKLLVENWEEPYFLLITWMGRKMWNMMKVGGSASFQARKTSSGNIREGIFNCIIIRHN
jgi:hypothetical protein